MSQILSRHLKCHLSQDQFLSLPWAQVLHLRRRTTTSEQDAIEIHLSVGRLTLIGKNLKEFWENLASGEIKEITVGQRWSSDTQEVIESFETTLDSELLQPKPSPRPKPSPPAEPVGA